MVMPYVGQQHPRHWWPEALTELSRFLAACSLGFAISYLERILLRIFQQLSTKHLSLSA